MVSVAVIIVGGIILVVVGICHFFGEKGKSEISFAIVIYTKALSYDVLSHAVGFGDSYDPTKMGKENSFLTIYVNSAIAKEVVESIGALIVENV